MPPILEPTGGPLGNLTLGASYTPDPEAFANVVTPLFTGTMTIAKAEQG